MPVNVPQGPKPNPSLAGLSFDHPPGWFEYELEILTWWQAERDGRITTPIPVNPRDSTLLHLEKEVLTWWHTARESILGLGSVAGEAYEVWRNGVLHYQYEAELADWWEDNRIDLLYTDFSFVCDQNSITPSITLSAGAPTPLWTVAESGVGAEYGYTTASFTHNRTAAGPMTVTLRNTWQIRSYVTALVCDNDGITSSINDLDLHQFLNLTSLRLHNNQLTGTIPSQLGDLTDLMVLSLEGNQLTGSIPSTLGSLSALVTLNLHENQLSGSIPSSLGSLSALTALSLSENQLTGSIPSTLGNLSALVDLSVFQNQLSGSVPAELGGLNSLERLLANHNQLVGVGSGALDLPALRSLLLQQNSMTQAGVDGIVDEMYAFRASYTHASPSARVDGDNAAPSGIYQAACPPTTGKEKIYELVNDSCGDGHTLWSIMFTA